MNPDAHGLRVELRLPFAWHPAAEARPAQSLAGSRILLRAHNEIEATPHESGADPALPRLEAKLDLILHWLGQSLFGDRPTLPQSRVWLDPKGVEWEAQAEAQSEHTGVPEHGEGWIELELSPELPGRLEWPARLVPGAGGRRRAEFTDQDEEMSELWTQWLFRRHRRAIQAARSSATSNAP